MEKVTERFLKYVKINTQSKEEEECIPSTKGQWELANRLVTELKEMGAENVKLEEHGYVYATIPATTNKEVPYLGFLAHMDTSPALTGKNVRPILLSSYQGGDIWLNKEKGIIMREEDFPVLRKYKGKDLITTDGTTLLGADDKAGIAEIMSMAEYFLTHPETPHGTIQLGFTPDEEVGRGADFFQVEEFQAEVAYTVDGGELGEFEYENFNAASAKIIVHGTSIHPGDSKGKMKHALLIGMEFQSMLPVFDNPMYTEGYEGFYHLCDMSGDVETACLHYIIRDHDWEKFQSKKQQMDRAASFLNEKYGAGTVECQMEDSYYNMKEKILPHPYLIDNVIETMKELKIEPKIVPIRGGTDGARLSYLGLPCPNICTGGHNFHGKYEFVCVQSMEMITELLIGIAKKFAE